MEGVQFVVFLAAQARKRHLRREKSANHVKSRAHRGQMRAGPSREKLVSFQLCAAVPLPSAISPFWSFGHRFVHLSHKVPPRRTSIEIWMLSEPMEVVARYLFSVPGGGPCRQLVQSGTSRAGGRRNRLRKLREETIRDSKLGKSRN